MTGPSATPSEAIAPLALRRAGAISWRIVVVVALLAIVVWLAYVLRTVTASILISLIVAATFAPLTRRLRTRGWSRSKASAVVTFSAVLVAGGVIALVILAFLPYASEMVAQVNNGAAEFKTRLQDAQLSPDAAAAVENAITAARAWIASNLAGLVGSIASAVTIGILSLFLTYYVLADGDNFWSQDPAGDGRAASRPCAVERLGCARARRWVPARHRHPGRLPGHRRPGPALLVRCPAGRAAGSAGLLGRLHSVSRAARRHISCAAHRVRQRLGHRPRS